MTETEAARLEPPLSTLVSGRIARLAGELPPVPRRLVRDLAGSPAKGLRGKLLAACAGPAPSDRGRVLRAAVVVELVHLASLLHDDVVDRATVRRRRPAAHAVAGEEMALLAGLAAFGLAAREAAGLGDRVSELFARTVANLARGQMLDVQRAFDVAFSPPEYDELVRDKTGELFGFACELGGMCSGMPADQVAVLGRFGLDLGAAFQILDDTLDFRTDNDKPPGTDHLLGLFGAPTLCALRNDPSGRLAALLLKPSFAIADLAGVRALVESLGGLREAAAMADSGYRQALARLDHLDDATIRERLREVVRSEWRKLA
jgi:geranylgeranyl pyrophosphate synthase